MPSHLRIQSSFDPVVAKVTYQTSPPSSPPTKKQRMSLTQTYRVASSARSKLGREAGRPDHNLRRLVGHANLLDNLMLDLADAEREQEAWFNQSVRKAAKPEEPRHVQWVDTIAESMDEEDEDDDADDSDSDSEIDDAELYHIPLPKLKQPEIFISSHELSELDDEDDDHIDDEEYDEDLALTRVPSRHTMPELSSDDSDSEDESMPPSPEQPMLDYSEKQRQVMTSTAMFDDAKSHASLDHYMIQQSQPIISAY